MLRQHAHDLGGVPPAPEDEALVAFPLRQRPHPHGDLGDDSEHPLATDGQRPQVRSGRRGRCHAETPRPRGRRQPDSLHHVFEPAVSRRRLPRRTRRGEAPERGPLERLRHVAQGETVRGEETLRVGASDPGLEHGQPRGRIDGDEPVEPCEIHHDHRGLVPSQRGHPTDDGRASAERHHPDVVGHARVHHPLHLVGVTGQHHGVGHGEAVGMAAAQQVEIGHATRPAESLPLVLQHVFGTDRLDEGGASRVRQPRRRNGVGGLGRDGGGGRQRSDAVGEPPHRVGRQRGGLPRLRGPGGAKSMVDDVVHG